MEYKFLNFFFSSLHHRKLKLSSISSNPIPFLPFSNISTMLFQILLFVAFYVFTKHFLSKLQNLPPSPFPTLPIIGHLYLLKTKKPLHQTLSNLSNKYGPIVFLNFGSRPVLLISSPSLAEECLTKHDVVFANRPRMLAGKHLGYNYTSLIWAPYGGETFAKSLPLKYSHPIVSKLFHTYAAMKFTHSFAAS